MTKKHNIIQVEEKVPFMMAVPLSIQHTFAMFSASVLVPLIFNINPGIVLFMNGIGTLLFILITKGKAPAYLGSSFAFIMPATSVIKTEGLGYEYALGGFVATGVVFCIVALIIGAVGTKWIDILLPPAAMGPVVALIGLELAGTAADLGGIKLHEGYDKINPEFVTVFVVTLAAAVFGQVLFRGFAAAIAILIAIVVGYIFALSLGMIDFSGVEKAALFAAPDFKFPKFALEPVLVIIPAALVVISEHIGHQVVTGEIVGRDLIKEPGLNRSLFADGFSTVLSGFSGSVPTTTYGENIGVMAITKVYSVWVIGGAAVFSICLGWIGKVSALIQTIPAPVMGGISFLLYGMIAASGLRLIVDKKVDYARPRNLALSSVVFVTGLSGAGINVGEVSLKGMSLATVVGILMGLAFYVLDRAKLTNDYESVSISPAEDNLENKKE